MTQRIALAINGGTGWNAKEIATTAKAAEEAGFDAIFSAEIRTDAIAIALFMGSQTTRINVGSWVSSVYLRHPLVCAQGAAFAAEVTGGRMILGLGVSHPAVNARYNIEMGKPLPFLRDYVADLRRALMRQGAAFPVAMPPAPFPVPIYLAALTSTALEQAAEIADGLMPVFWPPSRVTQSKAWIESGRQRRSDGKRPDMTLGIPTFIGNDLNEMRVTARGALASYAAIPTYQRLFRTCGFELEAGLAERGELAGAITDRLLDAFCLVGPPERCGEKLVAFREVGVDLPILYTPLGPDSALRAVHAFRQ